MGGGINGGEGWLGNGLGSFGGGGGSGGGGGAGGDGRLILCGSRDASQIATAVGNVKSSANGNTTFSKIDKVNLKKVSQFLADWSD